ncbi:MAG: hypothetical protein RIT43_1653, partial [Bacteroidota bacterium]
MEQAIRSLLLQNANELFGETLDEKLIQFQKTKKEIKGDITLVLFPFIKVMQCSPAE